MWYIEAIVNMINNKLHNIFFKNSFYWKKMFLAKTFQKDNNL
jgi:hypothetical protein